MYTEIGQKGDTLHVSFTKFNIQSLIQIYSPALYVHSSLWNRTKKADRLLTYRLFVCLYSAFYSLYCSTDSLTMQCVFSPI